MRKEPRIRPPVLPAQDPEKYKDISLQIKVVTPLWGGAAIAGEADPERPVNAKSIRGQLRFWWRACKGGQFKTAAELFKREEEVWGSVDVPSEVTVGIRDYNPGERVEWYNISEEWKDGRARLRGKAVGEGASYPGYALFPFQGETKRNGKPPTACRKGVAFTLQVRCLPAVEEDLLAALRAWLLFGGVGSRTRRGCGSLCCSNWKEHFGAFSAEPDTWLPAGLIRKLAPGASPNFPVLDRAVLARGGSCKSAVEAWAAAVNVMQNFRQGLGFGRNAGTGKRPGKSRWPEPDAIRKLAQKLDCHHAPKGEPLDYYPRADLGLPIIFQFHNCAGCPEMHMLGINDNATGRMASPFITKALELPGLAPIPIILMLNSPHAWEAEQPVTLVGSNANKPVKRQLIKSQIEEIDKSSLVSPMAGKDVRRAFLDFAQGAPYCFKEVTL